MPDASLQRKLRNWQMLLLDLTRANRLLYFKAERGSSVPITAPASADLFQLLVAQGKSLKFPASDQTALFEDEAEETSSQSTVAESNQSIGAEALAGVSAQSPATPSGPPAPSAGHGQPSSPSSAVIDNPSLPLADQSAVHRVNATADNKSQLEADSAGPAPKPYNNMLASSLSDAKLTRALYNLRARARSASEEQGVNVLFVAFGLLHWFDPETKDEVASPVVLVPVKLEKERGRDAYSLELLEDDILLNPTLAYKLKTEFNLSLPSLPATFEETGVAAYVEQVRALVVAQPGWSLSSDVVLGVFSFQKINLYQDISEHEDLYAAHPIIAALAGSAPLPPPPPSIMATELDDRVPPSNSFQVIDADSSQQEAIEAAKAGVSFVMQGPPGTGKSQTITNIIAEMLAAGKRVLFVSQKMAALEVVQHRLNQTGLGACCLQLHSHKRDKREVVKELIDSLDAPDVALRSDYQTSLLELEETRRQLNAYVKALHAPRFALHRSVFEAYGEITRWQQTPDIVFDVGNVTSVNAQTLAQRLQLLDRFEAMAAVIDHFPQHPWRGTTLRSVSFAHREQITQTLNTLSDLLPQYADRMKSLAAACGLRAPLTLSEAQPLLDLLKDNDPRLFTLNLDELQQRFEHDYSNVLRSIKGTYRTELKELDEINRPDDKIDYDEAVALLKQAQTVRQQLSGEPASAANADRLVDIHSFVQGTLTIRDRLDQTLVALEEIYGGEWPLVDQQAFNQAEFTLLPNWLIVRRNSLDQLEPYTALLRLSDEASAQGLGSFGKAALTSALPAVQWKDTYLLNFWQAFVDAAAQVDEVLRRFDSQSREALIVRFRELDQQQLI
ncbi:MAG TPA: DUF4011 domain-containing protein, partial [Anaerolineae bacterium]|nr:DUF4011 domain-containing protein [Anaerolineae bacterium]